MIDIFNKTEMISLKESSVDDCLVVTIYKHEGVEKKKLTQEQTNNFTNLLTNRQAYKLFVQEETVLIMKATKEMRKIISE